MANVKVEFKPSLEVKMTDQNKMQEKIKKIIKHSLEKECPNLSCEKELDQALSEIMDIIETDNCQCKDKSQIYLITHCRLCGKPQDLKDVKGLMELTEEEEAEC